MYGGLYTIIIALLCGGCAAQVSSNALDMNASYKGLLAKQILYNLGQAVEERSFFPSQIVVAQGSTVATNAVTPSVGIPLPASTIATSIAGSTTTSSTSTALGNAGINLSFTASSQFTWGVVPKTDPGELRRLRALYLYAVGKTPSVCEDEKGRALNGVESCFREDYVVQGGRHDVNQAFTQRPGCVLCGSAADQEDLVVNPKLRFAFVRTSAASGFRYFASYGTTRFYVLENGGDEAFSEFMLFVLEAISTADFIPFTEKTSPSPAPAPRGPEANKSKGVVEDKGPPPRVRVPPKSQSNQPFIFTIPL